MKGFQTISRDLGSVTFTAGQTGQLLLNKLPLKVGGRLVHLVGFTVRTRLVPAYTTAPTRAGHNASIASMVLYDGRQNRLQASGNGVRSFEALEAGKQNTAEAILGNGTGNPRYFSRFIPMGPPNFEGNPTDFALCVGYLQNGYLSITNGQLTDISADCTACTGEHQVTAHCILLDEIRIPPFYQRIELPVTNSQLIAGKGLYAYLGLVGSSAYGAIAAGVFGSVIADTGEVQVVTGVNAPQLTRQFNSEMSAGQIGGVMGEPENATYDVNQRDVNLTTPTAIQARVADLQPVIWCQRGARITKIAAKCDNGLTIQTGGSQSSGQIALIGRFLEQSEATILQMANEAAQKLQWGKGAQVELKLLSKADSYKGPLRAYLPYVAKA